MRKINLVFTVLISLAGIGFLAINNQVKAASVTLSPTNSEIALAGADITFTYTSTTTVEPIDTKFTFVVYPALAGALADCTAADGFADANGTGGAGSFGTFSTTGAIFTTSAVTATTGRSLCLKFPTASTPGSFSVFVSSTTGDYGLAMVHYGDNNDVNVSAIVGSTLAFNIVNLADSADTNVCQMGLVTTLAAPDNDALVDQEGECGYALGVGTNAANGFQVQITSNGGMTNGVATLADQTNNAAFVAGVEGYGLASVTAAAGISENGSFAVDSSPVPTVATNFISAAAPFTYTGLDSTSTDVTKIVHGMAISSSTAPGTYTQLVTYTVVANF